MLARLGQRTILSLTKRTKPVARFYTSSSEPSTKPKNTNSKPKPTITELVAVKTVDAERNPKYKFTLKYNGAEHILLEDNYIADHIFYSLESAIDNYLKNVLYNLNIIYEKINSVESLYKIYNLFKNNVIGEARSDIEHAYFGLYYYSVKDYTKMKEHYFAAINHTFAMENLAEYYRHVEHDYDKLRTYYLLSYEKGDSMRPLRTLVNYYVHKAKDYTNALNLCMLHPKKMMESIREIFDLCPDLLVRILSEQKECRDKTLKHVFELYPERIVQSLVESAEFCRSVQTLTKTHAHHDERVSFAAQLMKDGHTCVLFKETKPVQVCWCHQTPCKNLVKQE